MAHVYEASMAVEGACSLALDEEQLASAAKRLLAGDLALLPTETVYGVGVAVNAYLDSGVCPVRKPDTVASLRSSTETPPRLCRGWSTVPMPWIGMGRRFPMLFARLPRSVGLER